MFRLFLLRFFESYFRHRWLYFLPVVIMVAAGVYYFANQAPKYTAKGILYVNNPSLLTSLTAVENNNSNWWITPAQATSNELNELMQTDAFVRAVIQDTDLEDGMDGGPDQVFETLTAVRKNIRILPVGNNELYINASSEDPQVAYQLVNSVINSYVLWQINTKRADSQVAKSFFQDLIDVYAADLDSARQKLKDYYDAHPVPVRGERPASEQLEIERLQNEIGLASSRYMNALNKDEDANLAMTQVESDVRHTYVLLDAPLLPEKADFSRRKLALQLAGFIGAGFVLAIIGVAGGAVLDRSYRFPIDVQNHTGLPVLASIPDCTPRVKWTQRLFRRRKKASQGADEEKRVISAPEAYVTAAVVVSREAE